MGVGEYLSQWPPASGSTLYRSLGRVRFNERFGLGCR